MWIGRVKADGVSRNIRKIKIKETIKRIKVPGGDGENEVEDEIFVRNVEVELYRSQTAAAYLSKIFGLDAEDDLQRGRTAIKMYVDCLVFVHGDLLRFAASVYGGVDSRSKR